MAPNYESEIKQIVADITEISPDKLALDADLFKDLEVDSLKAIEIVAACEKKYHIVVPEQDIPTLRTIRQIVSYMNTARKPNK